MSVTTRTITLLISEKLAEEKVDEENRLLLTNRLSPVKESTIDQSEQIGVSNNNTVIAQNKTVETTPTVQQQQAKHFMNNNDRNQLIRTYSFDRIKQFPTYFCRHSSVEIAIWLASSKIRLYSYLTHFSKQFHGSLLAISVYTIVAFLAIQLIASVFAILTLSPPSGFIFLFGCILLVGCLASQIMINITPISINKCNNKNTTTITTTSSSSSFTTIYRKSRSRLPTRILPHRRIAGDEKKKLA